MNSRIVPIIVALLGSPVLPTSAAELSRQDQARIDLYQSVVKAAEESKTSIENAFSMFDLLRATLMRVRQEDRSTVIESLSGDEFGTLNRKIKSAIMNREETVFVEPDIDYFADLAAKRGEDADRDFFSALKATYSRSVWPVYIEQQTDYSGCARFGSMSLVESYGVWSQFREKHPNRYVARATEEMKEVLNKLSSICACGDAADVMRELEAFQTRFPASPASLHIQTHLESLRANRSDKNIRIHCRSG